MASDLDNDRGFGGDQPIYNLLKREVDRLDAEIAGASGSLPFVAVAVSQVAPPGFTYGLFGAGIVLTLPPGTPNARVRVVETANAGNSVVADTGLPDLIQNDGGDYVASMDFAGITTTLREWQFFGNTWNRVLSQPTAAYNIGSLPRYNWTSPDATIPGTTAVVTVPSAIDAPDPTLTGTGCAARFAIAKQFSGALTVSAFAGSMIQSPVDGTLVASFAGDAFPFGTVFEWVLSGVDWYLVSVTYFTDVIPYTPTTSADWAGDPTNVKDALDRIASVVAGLFAAPIP